MSCHSFIKTARQVGATNSFSIPSLHTARGGVSWRPGWVRRLQTRQLGPAQAVGSGLRGRKRAQAGRSREGRERCLRGRSRPVRAARGAGPGERRRPGPSVSPRRSRLPAGAGGVSSRCPMGLCFPCPGESSPPSPNLVSQAASARPPARAARTCSRDRRSGPAPRAPVRAVGPGGARRRPGGRAGGWWRGGAVASGRTSGSCRRDLGRCLRVGLPA